MLSLERVVDGRTLGGTPGGTLGGARSNVPRKDGGDPGGTLGGRRLTGVPYGELRDGGGGAPVGTLGGAARGELRDGGGGGTLGGERKGGRGAETGGAPGGTLGGAAPAGLRTGGGGGRTLGGGGVAPGTSGGRGMEYEPVAAPGRGGVVTGRGGMLAGRGGATTGGGPAAGLDRGSSTCVISLSGGSSLVPISTRAPKHRRKAPAGSTPALAPRRAQRNEAPMTSPASTKPEPEPTKAPEAQATPGGKRLLIGLCAVVVSVGSAYGIGRYQGKLATDAAKSREGERATEKQRATAQFDAQRDRAIRLEARRRLHLGQMAVEERNFGAAEKHLAKAADLLGRAKGEAALDELAVAIAATKLPATDDLGPPRQKVLELVKRFDAALPLAE